MEHSIIFLVALVLLIVFAGFQFQKVLTLFRGEKDLPSAVKTVVKAENVSMKKKKVVRKNVKTKNAKSVKNSTKN